jgi:predicted NBD/HSP70 family sugar kinase
MQMDTVLEETARFGRAADVTIGAVVDPSMVVLGGSIEKRIEVSLSVLPQLGTSSDLHSAIMPPL